MTNPAAFKATLVDFKNVRTRKLVQIVFEAPIEDADRILGGFGGYKTFGKESWWAVARLDAEPTSEPLVEPTIQIGQSANGTGKPRRKWDELSYAEQAGIRCGEPAFRKFIGRCFPGWAGSPEEFVRYHCRVKSRAELQQDTPNGADWWRLDQKYQSWLKAAEHVA